MLIYLQWINKLFMLFLKILFRKKTKEKVDEDVYIEY